MAHLAGEALRVPSRHHGLDHAPYDELACKVKMTPGLVVMGGDSCSKGCGFESRHRILDGFFHIHYKKAVGTIIGDWQQCRYYNVIGNNIGTSQWVI